MNKQIGATSVELAIIMVILFGVIFTTIDISRIMVVRALFKNTVNQTLRELKYQPVQSGGSFNSALNAKWKIIAGKFGVFLDENRTITIQAGFYQDGNASLNDIAAGSINNAPFNKQPIGVYTLSYPVKPIFLSFINNFNIDQTVLVMHEY